MRLKRVEMVGFKSFMDRTVLDFRDGVTSILGPNGCGKSNVVDAVRWVLGEQSPKQLRGEKMEDVIFKGSSKRKPVSTAEVTLVFDNTAGCLNIDYEEVAITRRVSREGGSDYFLNKTPCRLKDLKGLLYDTGAGNNAYSIIEQEMVGQVLNPNENKVRSILEEGSGVVRYKAKRKEALRKLDLTERDLLRVEDIIDEIGHQVRSLARQVGKARRHKRMYGELKSLEIIRAHHETKFLRKELIELEERIESLRVEGSGEDTELAAHRASIEEMRPAIDALETERRQKEHDFSRVESQLKQIEGELLVLKERVESGGRRLEEIGEERGRTQERAGEIENDLHVALDERSHLQKQLETTGEDARLKEANLRATTQRYEEARTSLAEAQQLSLNFLQEEAERKKDVATQETRIQSLREREQALEVKLRENEERRNDFREGLVEVEQNLAALATRREEIEAELGRHRDAETLTEQLVERALDERASSADDLARSESRHEIAARIAAEYEGYRSGAASLLKDDGARKGLRGALAETLVVEKGCEPAFELLFGEDADALLVDGLENAHRLATRLAKENLGQGSFLVDLGGEDAGLHHGQSLPGRPALDLVRIRGKESRHLRSWLGQVRVVDSAQEAVDAALAHAGRRISFLAIEGLFIRHDGLVRGGAGTKRQLSLFGRKEHVESLAQEVETLRARLAEKVGALKGAEKRRGEVKSALAQALQQLRALQDEAKEVAQLTASQRSILDHEELTREVLATEREEVRRRLEDLFAHLESMQQGLGRHGVDREASREKVSELGEQVRLLEEERENIAEAHAQARLLVTQREGEAGELESRLHRLRAMQQDLDARSTRLRDEDALLSGQMTAWSTEIVDHEKGLKSLFEEREGCDEEMRRLREQIDSRRVDLEKTQEEMRVISERQREKAEALGELENSVTRDRLTIQNFEERVQEKYRSSIEEGFSSLDSQELPKELVAEGDTYPMEQVDELLEDRRTRMEKLGPVNFAAMEEYDQKKARLEFLEQQRDDLLTSKEHLLKAIDKINRTARTLFRDTFESVRKNFREIFRTLFDGGEADLELLKADDPLEAEIHVHARPKGKRIDSVALLSGGERALTAIALLFSVYLIKPSPFCILDEVDASLDDLNIIRFVRLIERFQEQTQFIVITHNKLSMEAADHLYGITMEESGVSRLVSVSFEELDVDDPLRAIEDAAARNSQEPVPGDRLAAAKFDAAAMGPELKQMEEEG